MNLFNDVVSYNLKDFIDKSEFNEVNILRISKANSLTHELKKAEIFTKLRHSGIDVIVEPLLLERSIGRPDLLVLSTMPMIAYEIVHSETESSLLNKEVKYPFNIKIVRC